MSSVPLRIPLICALAWISLWSVRAPAQSEPPDNATLRTHLESELPAFWRLDEFDTTESVNYGNPVEPHWKRRFSANLSLAADTFRRNREEDHVTFVVPVLEKGFATTLHGVFSSRFRAGTWEHDIAYENDPIRRSGRPIEYFSGKVIVEGSADEIAWLEARRDERIAGIRSRFDAEISGLEDALESEVLALEQALAEQQAIHEQEIQRLAATHERELSQLKQTHEARKEDLKEALDSAPDWQKLLADQEAQREEFVRALEATSPDAAAPVLEDVLTNPSLAWLHREAAYRALETSVNKLHLLAAGVLRRSGKTYRQWASRGIGQSQIGYQGQTAEMATGQPDPRRCNERWSWIPSANRTPRNSMQYVELGYDEAVFPLALTLFIDRRADAVRKIELYGEDGFEMVVPVNFPRAGCDPEDSPPLELAITGAAKPIDRIKIFTFADLPRDHAQIDAVQLEGVIPRTR